MNNSPEVLFIYKDYTATVLHPGDEAILQGLLDDCADYFNLVTGNPPAERAAQELFEDRPPTKTLDDKLLRGLWEHSGKLIGTLDVVRDYPEPGEWFIGLLLIDPNYRQNGLGGPIYRAFEGWATRQGARSIGLGVVEANTGAYSFWHKLGFEDVEKRALKRFGDREHVVVVMRRQL